MTHVLKNHSLPVQIEGLPYILAGALLTLASLVLWRVPTMTEVAAISEPSLAARLFAVAATGISGLFTAFSIWFYRNPDRNTPTDDPHGFYSPADGRVLFVRDVPGDRIGTERAKKIAIFMSPVDVHVNRAPMTGRIEEIAYTRGKFFKADLDKASEENEHNWVILNTDLGPKVAFNQIAGFIARRIVCYVKRGDRLEAGERYGMIRFGSRMEVLLPPDSEVLVKAGEKTLAGLTKLARLKK